MALFRKGMKLSQEEDGKYVALELTKKEGGPVLGYAFPKDVQDRVRKIREQAKELRVMATRLDRIASEMEKRPPGKKGIFSLRKYFRKEEASNAE
jgi:hypothetical protein